MKLQTLLASAALALLSVVSTGAYSESEDSYDHVSKYHNPKGHYGVFDAVADSLDDYDSDSLDDYDSYDSFDDEEGFIAVGKSRKRSKRRRRSRFVVGRKVVDRMKKDMKVACPYLNSVDKKKKRGMINFCFVYSCYETNNDGTEIVAPQKIGGISLEVDLPMTKSTIRNPLFSSRGSEYWMNTWLNRVALWSTPIIGVAELALDARIFRNNQGLEGCINHEKNHTSTTKEDMSSLSRLVVKRWKDTIPAAKLLARQVRRSPHVIKKRKSLAYKKNSGVQTKERSMVWKKKKNTGSTKVALIRWKNKMEGAIIRALRAGDIKLKSNKPFSKWNVMRDHASAIDASFMSSTTFYAWIEGRRDIPLPRASEKVIDDLYYKYHEADEEPEDFTL